MRCPVCGHDETIGAVCSRCQTPLESAQEKSPQPPPVPPKKPAVSTPGTPEKGKHRSRPLHDLDMTIPELEPEGPEPAQPEKKPTKRDEKSRGAADAETPFKVTDRRHRFDDPNAAVDSGPIPKSAAGRTPHEAKTRPGHPPSVDFASFVYSLGVSAVMAMGESLPPGSSSGPGAPPPTNLVQAKELIDLIGLLEEKTKGNLTPEESEVLRQTLYSLRMKFIQAAKKK